MPPFGACATRRGRQRLRGVTGGRSPTTTRVRARSVSMLVSERPEPEIGPRATSAGSITSQVRGAIATGACSDDQTCSATGRMFVSFGVFASIVFTAWRNWSLTIGAIFQSVMSMFANVTWQRFEEKSTGCALVVERRRQFASQSRCEESEIQASRIGSPKPQEMHGHITISR